MTIFEETAGICAQFSVPPQPPPAWKPAGTTSETPSNFPEAGHAPTSSTVPKPVGHPRFAPLSALPPDQRLPDRRSEVSPAAAPSGLGPRQLPGVPSAKPVVGLSTKQIGFNCPSCMAILIIKQPAMYDGGAAPCPGCGVSILPPRIAASSSPFTLLSASRTPPHAMPHSQRPLQSSLRVLPPVPPNLRQAIPMGVPVSQKPGLPGAKKLAQVAML